MPAISFDAVADVCKQEYFVGSFELLFDVFEHLH